METDELTIAQAAKEFGVMARRIRTAAQRGLIPSRLAFGRLRVMKRADVAAYLKVAKRGPRAKEETSPHPNPATGADESDKPDSD